jgi:preprotein translocase subunit YajC
MNEFLNNEVFLYLALAFVVLAFFLWMRSRKRRKKELKKRRSLGTRIREKIKKD